MRGWCARARPRGVSATCPLSREKGGGKRGECVDGALERAQGRRGVVVVWGIPSVASLISGYIMRIYGVFGVRRMDLFFI